MASVHLVYYLNRGSANFLSRGSKHEMISLGRPQLLGKEKHSTHLNIVLLYLSKNYIRQVNKSRLVTIIRN